MLQVQDSSDPHTYLVDTSTEVMVLPFAGLSPTPSSSSPHLFAAKRIFHSYLWHLHLPSSAGQSHLYCTFLDGGHQRASLSGRFLMLHKLLVDSSELCLILPHLNSSIFCVPPGVSFVPLSLLSGSDSFLSLLNEFLWISHPIF